jgi:drug/metabolite transporter (DMT)-like permease
MVNPQGRIMEPRRETLKNSAYIGFVFGIITLIGDGFQTIINKSRPPEIGSLFYAWTTACVELGIIAPLFLRDQLAKRNPKQDGGLTLEYVPHFTRKDVARLVIAGTIFAFCAYYLIVGFSLVDSVTGILSVKTQPVSMLVIGAVMLKERLSAKEIAVGMVMLVLMAYIVTGGTFQVGNLSMGVIILLIVPVFWNVGHSIAKPFLNKRMLTINEFVFIRIGITTLILSVLFLIAGDQAELGNLASPAALVSIIVMGLLFAFLHTFWYKTVRALPLSIASFIVLPAPIVTAILAFFMTQESLLPYHLIGIGGEILCILMLILIQKKKASQAKPKPT